jgi:hypothetical protein
VNEDPIRDIERRVDKITYEIVSIKDDLRRLHEQDAEHVTLTRYLTVEKVVYGMVGLILVGFMTAMIALVVK